MDVDQKMTRESRLAFFNRVFSDDSVAAGIIQAVRLNASIPWNEEEDARRSDNTVDSFVKEFEETVKSHSRA